MKPILTIAISILAYTGTCQSPKALENDEITFIIVGAHATKCEIYYSNGLYEEVHVDTKAAKNEGGDGEEMNNSKVIGEILKYGWELHSITNIDSTVRFYFVRA